MIPAPFVSEDYLRSRLALPYGGPLVKPFRKIGFNPYEPLISRPIELQPVANLNK
jgi:hypothetical protein